MTKFPILIRFRDIIAGNGFVAYVLLDGRALLVKEGDDDHWVYGVQPGAVAGGASDPATALAEFKTRYQSVLYDIAGEAKSFDEFKKLVGEFLICEDPADCGEWDRALEEVRRSNASLGELPTVKAESVPVRIDIAEISKAEPRFNVLNEVARAA